MSDLLATDIKVEIKRNSRSRHIRLMMREKGVVIVTAPKYVSKKQINEIVKSKQSWIEQMNTHLAQVEKATQVTLNSGTQIPLLGSELTILTKNIRSINLQPRSISEILVEQNSDLELQDLWLEIPENTKDIQWSYLQKWYREAAREVFTKRCEYWGGVYSIEYGKISIRAQKSRWGSCSTNGSLSFNWRLVLAPLWILDSIVVHELTHIDEHNHSARFWNLLTERYPLHYEASKWLKDNGDLLVVNLQTQQEQEVQETLF